MLAAVALALLVADARVPSAAGQTVPPPAPDATASGENPIVRENQRPGGSQWQRVSPAPPRTGVDHPEGNTPAEGASPSEVERWEPPAISGYADRVSAVAGDTIRFFISTTAPAYDLSINRMGWYGGAGGREVLSAFGQVGTSQPPTTPDPETGLAAANWLPSYSLVVPYDWVSGVYLVRLLATNEARDVGYILFVVRDDNQPADLVYKLPVNTYQAYNNWGDKSFFRYNSTGDPAVKVSFDRPYSQWDGAGQFFDWDYPMIRWLEREGYNVTYITDLDAHGDTRWLAGRRALLSVGHDQFWSKAMRDTWEAARDVGRSLAFFGGNAAYWQVRYEPSARGSTNRVLVSYREARLDPLTGVDNSRVTVAFRSDVVRRPENALLGVRWEGSTAFGTTFPYVVQAADHWVFAGTDAAPGQAWSAVVGGEFDRAVQDAATPPGLVVLSASPVTDVQGQPSVANSAYYRQGGMVFAAGTVNWAWGLDDWRQPGLVDPRIQRVTANILEAFRQGRPPASPPASAPSNAPLGLLAVAFVAVAAAAAGAWYWRRRVPRRPEGPWTA
ncbi:MAG TPA: N,N-dimethylformamidase beta subunit family domain-containing protein [Chloroflexota bacterium]|nr:N,N-dimethylformamidase beta subunit family domain-containing protein [Chloroflexota bacterium]